ncbi:hypothetical protein BJ138DRAFT_1114685 [Hygrophoropsis aurantiaca]|uniref:Uncharacterized protein n=1 Tax=Hygrophoropsis aurantiaca TaxID=72124 RepID=A0ACB8A8H7_9AGAM|nr:hypothetical protein BJ138DRAFT_1114685 [Hygrophoropsis aurantiaca]
MVDWQSPVEIEKDSLIFIKLMHALLGIYVWEFFISLDFDWAVLYGQKKFRWPLIFYFAGRYCMLFSVIGIMLAIEPPSQVDCQALYTFTEFVGNMACGFASINLALRAIAIWAQKKWIIGLVVLLILGHWPLILLGGILTASWIPGTGCAIVKRDTAILGGLFIYSMCFDFTILCLAGYKLAWAPQRAGIAKFQSRLVKMLFADGLAYFFIAFLANLLATIFMLLDLNPAITSIFGVPAAIFPTIVACRVVRRLSNFYNDDQQTGSSNGISFRNATGVTRPVMGAVSSVAPRTNIHVQMETFTRAEDVEAGGDHARLEGDSFKDQTFADSFEDETKRVRGL